MATFIKAGFWEKLCQKCTGYKGWLNLDQLIESKIPESSYKVYTALLSQTGGDAPSETVIENTIGIEPNSWIRDNSGVYRLSPSTSGLFTSNKTVVFINNCDATGSPQAELSTNITSKLSMPDQIYVYTYDSSNSFSDDILKQCSIEIRVYN